MRREQIAIFSGPDSNDVQRRVNEFLNKISPAFEVFGIDMRTCASEAAVAIQHDPRYGTSPVFEKHFYLTVLVRYRIE